MDWKTLESLGFTSVGGAIDRGNVNYGRVSEHGALLTPEGIALVEELLLAKTPRAKPRVKAADATTEG